MVLVALAAVFITSLLVSNVIAVKVLAIGPIAVSAGVLAYPLTFVVTDSIAEVYGRKVTTRLVWIGFCVQPADGRLHLCYGSDARRGDMGSARGL